MEPVHAMTPEERFLDYQLSCDLGTEVWRERLIRSGEFPPRPDHPEEIRWATEGPIESNAALDTVVRKRA